VKPEEVDDPKQFKWKKYVEMDQQWRDFEDAHPGTGEKMVKKIPCGTCCWKCYKCTTRTRFYHGAGGISKYLALIGMLAGLANLNAPVAFEPNTPVFKATTPPNAGIPASNEMLDKLAAAHTNAELENTQYLFAFANGKSAVRVCTDLSQEKFEQITGVTAEKYFRWDVIKNKTSSSPYPAYTHEEFVELKCDNVTTLALNGGCQETLSGYGDRNFQSALETGAEKGKCGDPSIEDKMWSPPQGAEGWLWHYMIRTGTPDEFHPDTLTNRTCNTTTCDTSVCLDGDCFDTAQSSCIGWFTTSACEEKNPVWDNSTLSETSCTTEIGNADTIKNGYCDCGAGRKRWMCGVANSFTCQDVCKCVTPAVDETCTNEVCSCDVNDQRGTTNSLPDWMYDENIISKHTNKNCKFLFGRFNTNICTGKRVLGYAMQVDWIVNFFLVSTIVRIVNQVFFMYWGLFEDNPAYRIMFASQSLIIFTILCCRKGRHINAAIEREYLQGWPWVFLLVDRLCATTALCGIAFAASPFPEIARGKFTLFFLWVTALIEINGLANLLLDSYYKKAYVQVGSRGVGIPWLPLILRCKCFKFCKNDLPWCIKDENETLLRPWDLHKKAWEKIMAEKALLHPWDVHKESWEKAMMEKDMNSKKAVEIVPA
jgi:hypothetical protein